MIFTASPGESHLEITLGVIRRFVIGERKLIIQSISFGG